MAVCLFSLGAEPFSAAAVQWGRAADHPRRAVAGDPRNRDLPSRRCCRFAGAFNAYFEAAWATHTVHVNRNGREITEVPEPPQILVPNRESIMLLGRLGRRLRFVEDAPDELLRLGAHLAFLREHAVDRRPAADRRRHRAQRCHFHMPLSDWERDLAGGVCGSAGDVERGDRVAVRQRAGFRVGGERAGDHDAVDVDGGLVAARGARGMGALARRRNAGG